MARIGWRGVFPAASTRFREDFPVDIGAARRMVDGLIRDGVSLASRPAAKRAVE